jgi:hypothetical protein
MVDMISKNGLGALTATASTSRNLWLHEKFAFRRIRLRKFSP